MSKRESATVIGRAASLHMHPAMSGGPMLSTDSIHLVAGRGIEGNKRHWDRKNSKGEPSKRQVSLIEREQLEEHAAALKSGTIVPGLVRANIETTGFRLLPFIGKRIRVGEAVLLLTSARTPCAKMDAAVPGLRALMENSRQGVMAQILESGWVRSGDPVELLD